MSSLIPLIINITFNHISNDKNNNINFYNSSTGQVYKNTEYNKVKNDNVCIFKLNPYLDSIILNNGDVYYKYDYMYKCKDSKNNVVISYKNNSKDEFELNNNFNYNVHYLIQNAKSKSLSLLYYENTGQTIFGNVELLKNKNSCFFYYKNWR